MFAAAQPASADELPVNLFTGRGFDACAAPSLTTMRRWARHSPYGAAGIYFGGINRACAQPRLTPDWVASVDRMGWRLLPLYAGLQAPCRKGGHRLRRIDPAQARDQGRDQAADAVSRADALGLDQGSALYLDMENYPRGNARCTRAVLDFVVGWTVEIQDSGYWAGFYSSADSGIADLAAARRAGLGPLPDALWYAHWNGRARTSKAKHLSPQAWSDHQRVHQYRGNVRESYGGAALTVDRNAVDSAVAVVRY
ncbi:DUF1906 domain-containing protein [Peterkaempfera bronchialis]|uniref:DUF1906 domain-containing protein n=2 Tax=Peterkaempfera bronchialis TaxID=2126346 RepID=A0A345T647_9ACTN|nr:DUF1906 domain-containing protein [Peterkaempfera bronchialis]